MDVSNPSSKQVIRKIMNVDIEVPSTSPPMKNEHVWTWTDRDAGCKFTQNKLTVDSEGTAAWSSHVKTGSNGFKIMTAIVNIPIFDTNGEKKLDLKFEISNLNTDQVEFSDVQSFPSNLYPLLQKPQLINPHCIAPPQPIE